MEKEEYVKAQEAFVKKYGIKKGSKVKVIKVTQDYENGWDNAWVDYMKEQLGNVLTVVGVDGAYGISAKSVKGSTFSYPYFAFEPVTKGYSHTTYIRAQTAFVKEYDVKVGDSVRIMYKQDSPAMGWTTAWLSSMNKTVNQVGKVTEISNDGIRVEVPGITYHTVIPGFFYPYYVLRLEEVKDYSEDIVAIARKMTGLKNKYGNRLLLKFSLHGDFSCAFDCSLDYRAVGNGTYLNNPTQALEVLDAIEKTLLSLDNER